MPAVRIILPPALRPLCGNAAEVTVRGGTTGELIRNLQEMHPGLRGRLCDDSGQVRPFLRVFKNGRDTRTLQGGATPVEPGDEIALIPAAVGG